MRWLRRARVAWKRLLSRAKLVPSFCKVCGRDVRDFVAPDDVWERVVGDRGTVRCYDCFADACARAGLERTWRLVKLDEQGAS